MAELHKTEVLLNTRGRDISMNLLYFELSKIKGLRVTDIKRVEKGYVLYLQWEENLAPWDIFNMGMMVGLLAMEIIAFVKFGVTLTNNICDEKGNEN